MTEVIACPACRHVVRVPTDWLGTTVACPECKATFTAPVRDNGRLTDPVLLTAPAPTAAVAPPTSSPFLVVPGVGLILVGVVSLGVNGWVLARFLDGAGGGKEMVRDMIPQLRQAGVVPQTAGADPAADDDKAAAEFTAQVFWAWPVALGLAGLTTAGGVCLVRRRNYRLAQLGCLAAAVNLPHLCCVPGAVFGLWGVLLLLGDDGFGRPREPGP